MLNFFDLYAQKIWRSFEKKLDRCRRTLFFSEKPIWSFVEIISYREEIVSKPLYLLPALICYKDFNVKMPSFEEKICAI